MADALLGPSGGNGGHEFAGYAVPAGAQVRAVRVVAGWVVNAIQLVYADGSGATVELDKIGGHGFGGGQEHAFSLEPGEYLTGISGRAGSYVDSLRLHTNQRVSDTYGGNGGDEPFEYVAAAGSEVVGFFGRADWHIDKLGVIVRERTAAPAKATKAAATKAATVKAPVVELPAAGTATPKTQKKAAPVVVATETAAAEPASKPAKSASKKPAAPEGQPAVAAPTAPKKSTKTPVAPDLPAVPAPTTLAPEADAPPAAEGQPAIKPPAAARAPKAASKARPGGTDLAVPAATPDDLIKIEGIGPKIAQVLADNGITTFAALADASPEYLRSILVAAGNRYRIADPTTWPQQAALAATGDWSAFDALVARLKAGRTE